MKLLNFGLALYCLAIAIFGIAVHRVGILLCRLGLFVEQQALLLVIEREKALVAKRLHVLSRKNDA